MRIFSAMKDLGYLEKAAQWYTVSLEYNALYGEDFRDVRRAREWIYANLKDLNIAKEFPEIGRAHV